MDRIDEALSFSDERAEGLTQARKDMANGVVSVAAVSLPDASEDMKLVVRYMAYFDDGRAYDAKEVASVVVGGRQLIVWPLLLEAARKWEADYNG